MKQAYGNLLNAFVPGKNFKIFFLHHSDNEVGKWLLHFKFALQKFMTLANEALIVWLLYIVDDKLFRLWTQMHISWEWTRN